MDKLITQKYITEHESGLLYNNSSDESLVQQSQIRLETQGDQKPTEIIEEAHDETSPTETRQPTEKLNEAD